MSEHDRDIATGDELAHLADQIPTLSTQAGEAFLPAYLQDPGIGFDDTTDDDGDTPVDGSDEDGTGEGGE